ncbi:unnamed protein product [Prorocentrum cordatum]|uniref:Uncharacterized protein n=1 Tax=Prorocentrum cordatum TaxID=2364126 RepID=A0ABN9Y9D5_9DINO|nr:unnamed protein product [Polarella glacialis]
MGFPLPNSSMRLPICAGPPAPMRAAVGLILIVIHIVRAAGVRAGHQCGTALPSALPSHISRGSPAHFMAWQILGGLASLVLHRVLDGLLFSAHRVARRSELMAAQVRMGLNYASTGIGMRSPKEACSGGPRATSRASIGDWMRANACGTRFQRRPRCSCLAACASSSGSLLISCCSEVVIPNVWYSYVCPGSNSSSVVPEVHRAPRARAGWLRIALGRGDASPEFPPHRRRFPPRPPPSPSFPSPPPSCHPPLRLRALSAAMPSRDDFPRMSDVDAEAFFRAKHVGIFVMDFLLPNGSLWLPVRAGHPATMRAAVDMTAIVIHFVRAAGARIGHQRGTVLPSALPSQISDASSAHFMAWQILGGLASLVIHRVLGGLLFAAHRVAEAKIRADGDACPHGSALCF